jgi:prevent-host-death family protein
MIEVITASKLKEDLLKVLKEVEKGDSFLIIRKSSPSAVLINYELFESLKESVEILKNKELLKKILNEGKD